MLRRNISPTPSHDPSDLLNKVISKGMAEEEKGLWEEGEEERKGIIAASWGLVGS